MRGTKWGKGKRETEKKRISNHSSKTCDGHELYIIKARKGEREAFGWRCEAFSLLVVIITSIAATGAVLLALFHAKRVEYIA